MSPEHPFFNSSQIMTIKEIDKTKYRDFANGFFAGQKREIDEDAFSPDGKLDNDDVLNAVNRIIGEQEINYQNNYNLLTENQAALLTAIAKQGVVSARQGVPVP